MDTKPHFIAERLAEIRDRITRAEQAYHRPPHAVTLLAVSKAQPEQSLRAAYEAGQRCFGESYLQEASSKMTALADLAINWHFIGRMQANKTRQIAESFSWVHGVDRLKIAQRLSDQRPGHLPPLNICLQIKLSDEPTKSGAHPDVLLAVARDITKLTGTRLRGLSVIPKPTSNFAAQRKVFGMLRAAGERLADDGITIDTLSMGMSDDFEAAIAEGATIVRVGTSIFGERRIISGDGLVRSDQ